MADKPGIFPTFFLSGFECSTFMWREQGRRDLAEETQHREKAQEDYAILHDLGIAVAREGIPWPMVDKPQGYDFSPIDPLIEAMNQAKIIPIWDLCHYGYPDRFDPFGEDFADHFARYCREAARYVTSKTPGPCFFTPINEITYFSFMGGEWGWIAPYGKDKPTRYRLRLALCRAAIAGVKAIREVEPSARMVQIDPLVNIVAPRDRPDLIEVARHETYEDTFVAWDVLAGKSHPELGGNPEILDIVGINSYSFGQMEYREHGPHAPLPPGDDRIKPLCEMLAYAWERYHRPMIIAETSGLRDGRAAWFNDVMQEAMAAVNQGIDLHGICLFPGVDMPDWNTGEWLHNGICDLVAEGKDLRRVRDEEYAQKLTDWQKTLNRVTVLDKDPLSDPVELQDVIEAAKRFKPKPDADWS